MIADLTGRTALVTGAGTPEGMGATIAGVLARQGAQVAIGDIDVSGVVAIAAAIEPTVMAVELDVASDRSVSTALASVIDTWGRLDILVNNAGIGGARAGVDETEWEGTFQVNVLGTVRCTEAALPQMRERQYGKIINIASIAGHSSRRTGGAYAASKAAVLRYTKGLAVEEAPSSINVNAVCPGAVWTAMQSRAFQNPSSIDPSCEGLEPHEAFVAYYAPMTPLRRPQTATDVGVAVAFLASDDAANITGQCLHVDGGAILD